MATQLILFNDILAVDRADTGAITMQLGDVISEQVTHQAALLVQQPGFVSMPSNPAAGRRAAQAIGFEQSDGAVIIGVRDVRSLELAGNLGPGESSIYAAGEDGAGQAQVICKGDGAVTITGTTTNVEGGPSWSARFAPDGIAINYPFFSLKIDADGIWFNHASGVVACAGAAGSIPGPLSAISSFIDLEASSININGAQVGLGPSPAVSAVTSLLLPGVPITAANISAAGVIPSGCVRISL